MCASLNAVNKKKRSSRVVGLVRMGGFVLPLRKLCNDVMIFSLFLDFDLIPPFPVLAETKNPLKQNQSKSLILAMKEVFWDRRVLLLQEDMAVGLISAACHSLFWQMM